MKKSKLIIASALLSASVVSFGLVACNTPVEPDVTAPVIKVNGASEYLINYGSTFTLPKITIQDDKDENVTWSLTVKNGDTVATVDETGSFVAEKSGTYTVSVDASDSSGNSSNKQITVEVRDETEINNFDTATRLEGVTYKGIAEVSINTDPEYVRYGTGSLKLEVKEHIATSWPGIIVSELPITDILDYYSISFWIFNDGTQDINIYLQRNELNGKAKHTIPAKAWTKIEVLARDYDNVFTYMKKSGAEPEVGTCEDIKCFTFHFANPANVPAFNIYVDQIQVNKEKVNDTLDISAEITHPVANVEYDMPEVSVSYGGTEVSTEITYELYDKNYNKIELSDNKCTFNEIGEYTLIVTANYNGLKSSKNFMLVCSSSRADNEIAFFEDESNLSFFTSEHFEISLNTDEKHTDNNSTASMKLHSCQSRWPYLTISGIPHADLEDVAYIYMYVKTDYQLQDSETAYLGIRDGNRGKVLKRISLTNDWKCFALTKEQLAELGVTTLEGLQMSVELYDTTNPKNEGGWCPVAFNTYIDNFTVGKVAEPIEKEEGVVLDFANYRDLDDVTSNGYISYNFSDLEMTLNNKGSLKVSASAKWPEFHFGDRFDSFAIEGVKNVVFDVFVPTFSDGYVRLGINDSQYQKVTPEISGKWVSLYVPISAVKGETLKGIEVNIARNNGSDWANVGTLYIGKIWLDYEGKTEEIIDPEFSNGEVEDDLYIFTVKNDLYLISLNSDKAFVNDGEKSIKLSAVPKWPQYYFSQYFIEFLNENNYVKFSFDVYVDDAGSDADIDFYEGCISAYSKIQDAWFTVTLNVADVTTSTLLQLNKLSAHTMNMYVDNFKYYTQEDIEPEVKEFTTIETEYDLNMFSSEYTLSINEDVNFVKEGSKSIKLTATPRWPKLYFTQEFIDYLVTEGVQSISLDLYIDNAGSVTNCTRIEGYKLIYQNDLPVDQWFTITLSVSELSATKFLQFNKDAANSLSIYVDNMQYEKPTAHEKLAGVIYDFYDTTETAGVVHMGGNVATAEEFDGVNTAKFVLTSGAWSMMHLSTAVDEIYSASDVKYIYLNMYFNITLDDGEYIRFTYYTWNGTTYAENNVDYFIGANEWVTVRIPVLEGTEKLSDINFLFPIKKTSGWASIGQKSGEALYIREVGVINTDTAYGTFTNAESNADIAIFTVKNEQYRVTLNSNENYVKDGEYSIRLNAEPKWPQYYFSQAFIDWLKEEGYTSFTFDAYIEDTTGIVSAGEGVTSSITVNTWKTYTVDVSTLTTNTRIQINKSSATPTNIYIDNIQYIKADA